MLTLCPADIIHKIMYWNVCENRVPETPDVVQSTKVVKVRGTQTSIAQTLPYETVPNVVH